MIVGVLYDQYTPAVEARIISDFIQLSSVYKIVRAAIVDERCVKALTAVGIDVIRDFSLAEYILRYKVGDSYPEEPSESKVSSDRVYNRDLKTTVSTAVRFDFGNHSTLPLKEDNGYPYVSSINRMTPPVNSRGPINIDPTIIWLFGK